MHPSVSPNMGAKRLSVGELGLHSWRLALGAKVRPQRLIMGLTGLGQAWGLEREPNLGSSNKAFPSVALIQISIFSSFHFILLVFSLCNSVLCPCWVPLSYTPSPGPVVLH